MIKVPKIRMKYFLMALPVIAVLGPMGFITLERFTVSNQRFCLTCHYQMWGEEFHVESQVHPRSVRCPECHAVGWNPIIPPKDFSSDPERVSPNCVRCHQRMTTKSDTEGFKYNRMKIKIPHELHVDTMGMLCTDCHYNVKHDKHIPQTNRPRMIVCFTCHDQETTSCLKCHPKGEHLLLSMLPRHETVNREICNRCHEGFANRTQEIYGIEFQHGGHLARNMSCGVCHENRVKHGRIVKEREECMSCHHNEAEAECTTCHGRQLAMRNGTAVPGIDGVPDVMAESVDCSVCHAGIGEGHSADEVRQTCTGCHDETVFKTLDDVQAEISKDLEEARGMFDKLADKTSPEALAARELLRALERDGSRGFHNPHYAREIMKQLDQKLTVLLNAGPG